MILGITGHRKFYHSATSIRKTAIDFLEQHNPEKVYIGMAAGFDHMIANVCVQYDIPFVAAIPCEKQDKFWSQKLKREHAKLLSSASEIVHVNSGAYKAWKMIARNRWIVNNSQQLLCYVVQNSGGSNSTIQYAYKQGKPVVNINDFL